MIALGLILLWLILLGGYLETDGRPVHGVFLVSLWIVATYGGWLFGGWLKARS